MDIEQELIMQRINHLLQTYPLEEILAEAEITPELAVYYLVQDGFLELPENEPLG